MGVTKVGAGWGSIVSVASGIGTLAQAGNVVVGFIAEGSVQDLLFRSGILFLILLAATVLFVVARSDEPDPSPERVAKAENEHGLEVVYVMVIGFVGVYAVGFLFFVIIGAISVRTWLELVGFVGFFAFPIALVVGREEVMGFIRNFGRPTRSRPRCGYSVPAGDMTCPSCSFDFWKVGG